MSVAFDAVSNPTPDTAGGTTHTFTHTPVGTPSGVVVAAWHDGDTVSSATYGGATLTLVTTSGQVKVFASATTPPSGAQTVVVTFASNSSTPLPFESSCVSVTGGDTASPVRASGVASGASPRSATVTIPSGDVGIAFAAGNTQTDTYTPSGGATQMFSYTAGSSGDRGMAGSRQAGPQSSMGFTTSFTANSFDVVAMSMADASGGAALQDSDWYPMEPQTNPLTVSLW